MIQPPPSVTLTHDLTQELDRLAHGFTAERRLPGLAAGIVAGGGLAWAAGAGVADIDTGRPVTPRTLFRVASISKTLTATAVMQLRDRGLVHLDDPVVRFVPEIAALPNPFGRIEGVTVRRLLTHTSGLVANPAVGDGMREFPWADENREAPLTSPDRLPILEPPGSAFRYSNAGYGLLGILVERLVGRPLVRYVADEVTGPLGMADTTAEPAADQAARSAIGYDPSPFEDRPVPVPALPALWNPESGGYWSTVEDLARWLSFHLEPYVSPETDAWAAPADRPTAGRILALSTRREMHRQAVLVDGSLGGSWGLGWAGDRRGEQVLVGHTGGLPGYVSRIGFSPADHVGVIVLVNTEWDDMSLPQSLLAAVLPAVRAATAAATRGGAGVPAAAPPVPERWRDLLGAYRSPTSLVHVAFRGGRLVQEELGNPAAHPYRLAPTDDPARFELMDDEGRAWGPVVFVRGTDGRVSYLTTSGFAMVREA